MAWLEFTGGMFRIGFRFGERKHHLPLNTPDRGEADATLGRFEANFRYVEQGVIDPPPDGAHLSTYIVSSGKLGGRPSEVERVKPKTFGDLFDGYLASFPEGAKEASTCKTERIHIGHLRRQLATKPPLDDVTSKLLQEYVIARTQVVATETVRKEVGTFTTIWNRWAVPQGVTARPAPATNLHYPKARSKPPFQTREQIERQIARRELPSDVRAKLWECLFLTVVETDEVLDFVRRREQLLHAYPMAVFAAHTGRGGARSAAPSSPTSTLYLRWLDRHQREAGEEPPLGLIRCEAAGEERVELLQLGASGIRVATYLTDLPPKAVLEQKLRAASEHARAKLTEGGV